MVVEVVGVVEVVDGTLVLLGKDTLTPITCEIADCRLVAMAILLPITAITSSRTGSAFLDAWTYSGLTYSIDWPTGTIAT